MTDSSIQRNLKCSRVLTNKSLTTDMDNITEILSNNKYPAKAHAAKVASYVKSRSPYANGIFYLEGQKTRMIEDNDEPVPFR